MLFIKADKSDYLLVSIKEDVGNGCYYDRIQFYLSVLVCDFVLLFEGCGKSRQDYGKITKAYNLPCDYVIHTVGPIWNGGRSKEEELLASCYFHSMQVELEHGIRSIAFPSISTGVYRFPVELAAKIAVKTVSRFLEDNKNSFDLVEWVLFDSVTESVYEKEVDKLYS